MWYTGGGVKARDPCPLAALRSRSLHEMLGAPGPSGSPRLNTMSSQALMACPSERQALSPIHTDSLWYQVLARAGVPGKVQGRGACDFSVGATLATQDMEREQSARARWFW